MCGIVGILGKGAAAPRIVEALKRLEYRGYDSAGVATLEYGELRRVRAEGKLRNLEAKLADRALEGEIGIGHTRWATHGKPTETNAHPHASDRLAVVHNGIIENFRVLREELSAKGYRFATETDTEIAAFLVTDGLNAGKSPAEAVQAALARMKGAFALVFLFKGEDNLLIGARQGAPLAVGQGDGEMFLGSDALALAPFTDRVAYLEEGDWVIATRTSVEFRDARQQCRAAPLRQNPGRRPAGREGQLPPLHGQGDPRAAGSDRPHRRPLRRHGRAEAAAVRLAGATRARSRRVTIVACGTAYMAGLIGKYWIERFARLPVEVDVASEYRYREPPVDKGGLTIFVSQSGETADTLASLRYVKENGGAHGRGGQRARPPASPGWPTRRRRRSPGRRSASPRPRRSPASSSRMASLALALGKARGTLSEADEAALRRRTDPRRRACSPRR